MRVRTFLGFVPFLLCASPILAADDTPAATLPKSPTPDAAQITEHWRTYFQTLQSLTSWSYNAQMRLTESDPKQPAAAPHLISDIKIRYASATPSFYREMQVRETDKAPYQVVILAYNGKKYQMAVANPKPSIIDGHQARKLMLLGAKAFPNDPTLKTNFHLPLAMPFIFVSEDITDVPFSTLQKGEFWADVRGRITGVTPGNWDGHPGFTVAVNPKKPAPKPGEPKKDEVEEHIEVFVDETSGLPLRLRNIDDKTQAIIGEIKVTQLRAEERGLPAFPLRIELSGQGKPGEAADKNPGTGLIEVEAASLSMNEPIAASRFTVPQTSMEYVIENDKIVYSSFPESVKKVPAKKAAKTTTKKSTKTTAKKSAKRR